MQIDRQELREVVEDARDCARGIVVGAIYRSPDDEAEYRYGEGWQRDVFRECLMLRLPDFILTDGERRVIKL